LSPPKVAVQSGFFIEWQSVAERKILGLELPSTSTPRLNFVINVVPAAVQGGKCVVRREGAAGHAVAQVATFRAIGVEFVAATLPGSKGLPTTCATLHARQQAAYTPIVPLAASDKVTVFFVVGSTERRGPAEVPELTGTTVSSIARFSISPAFSTAPLVA
jgi:hypothetical protein